MNLSETFSFRCFLNLSRRQDRRYAAQAEFERAGLEVERFPAVDGKRLGWERDFLSAGYHALAITNRMVLREAALRRAPAMLMFEDDVVIHPRFQELAAQIELPDDWEMFFWGCQHLLTPEPVGPGLVRVAKAWDWHAVAFRASAYLKVRRALTRITNLGANDQRVAELQREMPTYAAWPNLAWQRVNLSDLTNGTYSAYLPNGGQARNLKALEGLETRMERLYGPGGGLRLKDQPSQGALRVGLCGGPGEQMFQYACGLSIALESDRKLLAVPGRLPEGDRGAEDGRFQLGIYGIQQQEPEGLQTRDQLESWENNGKNSRELILAEISKSQAPIFGLGGWWQAASFFTPHAQKVRDAFQMEPAGLSFVRGRRPVCLELRKPHEGGCSPLYVETAVRIMLMLVPEAHFFLIGNACDALDGTLLDPEACTKLATSSWEEELRVMLACDAHVLSGSTLGWWGAWLSSSKQVIRPAATAEGVGLPEYPAAWIAIPEFAAGISTVAGRMSALKSGK